MKRVIIAAVLLAVCVISYFVSELYIDSVANKTRELLSECVSAYESGGDAGEKAEKLKKYWSDNENGLSFFVNHNMIDDVELTIEVLAEYSKTNEKEIFKEYSKTVEILIHQLLEDTSATIHSIF